MTDGDPIYLDHNATTPILPEVVDAMLPYLREHFGNPSSTHVHGARARSAVDRAREQVATAEARVQVARVTTKTTTTTARTTGAAFASTSGCGPRASSRPVA